MTTATVKDEARRLVDRLPDDATWEDLQYQIYFRQAVEAGLKDSQEGRIVPLEGPAAVRVGHKMTVNWTEAALADLQGVEAYISRHSPQRKHTSQ